VAILPPPVGYLSVNGYALLRDWLLEFARRWRGRDA
jgi:hypothetical protein